LLALPMPLVTLRLTALLRCACAGDDMIRTAAIASADSSVRGMALSRKVFLAANALDEVMFPRSGKPPRAAVVNKPLSGRF
jgi:hypothetical protein